MRSTLLKIKEFISKYYYALILVSVCILLSVLNYSPNTWQTGWDTLHPEFNFSINIPRHFFGMWQENQGLGNVGGHSHAADMPRIMFLFFSSFFLPVNFLRYFYVFLTLIIGPLGVYFFLLQVLKKHNYTEFIVKTSAFLGALFYIFNLGTVQQFIVQLEMYTTLYGFLPWIFLFAVRYIDGEKKALLYFAVVSLFATPLAYAVTVYIALFVCLVVFMLFSVFSLPSLLSMLPFRRRESGNLKMGDSEAIKRAFSVLLVSVLVNSFWLFPSIYFGFNHSKEVSNSLINRHFSPEIFEYNVKHGNFKDLLTLKGFLLDWQNYDFNKGKYVSTMYGWVDWVRNSTDFHYLEYIMISLIIFGFVYQGFSRNRFFFGIASATLFSAFMFLTTNPPFGAVFLFLKSNLPILGEIFRNPYTKFSAELAFFYSIFVCFAFVAVFQFFKRIELFESKKSRFAVVALFAILFAYYMKPMFRGNLLNSDVRVSIPKYYFDFYDYMNNEKDIRRVATLPIHNFLGWAYYNWGYQGAGFIWFGLKQPVLDRDFDRWNRFNEMYYKEMSAAIYAENVTEVENVVRKYGIGYILLDEAVVSIGNTNATYIEETKKTLAKSALIKFDKKFGSISLYKVADSRTGPVYANSSANSYVLDYPFINSSKVSTGDNLVLEYNKRGLKKGDYSIVFKDFGKTENYLPISVYAKNFNDGVKIRIEYNLPKIYVNEKEILDTANLYEEYLVPRRLEGLVVSINGKVFFDLSGLSSEYKKYGTFVYSMKEDNRFSVYSQTATAVLSKNSDLSQFSRCEGVGFDALASKNTLSLLATSSNACVEKALGTMNNSLLKTNYSYTSELGNKVDYCIDYNGKCSSNLSFKRSNSANFLAIESDYVTLAGQNSVKVKFYVYADANFGVSKADISDISIESYPLLYEKIVKNSDLSDTISQSIKNYVFPVLSTNAPFSVKAVFDVSNPSYFFSSSDLCKYSHLESKQELGSKKSCENGLSFSVLNTFLYDSVNIFNIPYNTSYALVVASENSEGNKAKFSVSAFNSTRNFVFEPLYSSKEIFLLSPSAESNKGYQFGFTNTSIGKNRSTNVLKSVDMFFYPLNFLSGIELKKVGDREDNINFQKPYEPNVVKYTPFIYVISGVNKGEKLVFEMSYEKGWVAFGAKDHEKVKGWANGWTAEDGTVFILFLPALLQVFGYVLMFSILIFLVYTANISSQHKGL